MKSSGNKFTAKLDKNYKAASSKNEADFGKKIKATAASVKNTGKKMASLMSSKSTKA